MSERIDLTVEERREINQMAVFISLFYARLFLRSRIAVFAPTDDLELIGKIMLFHEQNETIANAVILSVTRHGYLVYYLLETFTRGLFARKLFSTSRPSHFEIGKPTFPKIETNTPPMLLDLIGRRSWLLFS
jgi:hypothetical protein